MLGAGSAVAAHSDRPAAAGASGSPPASSSSWGGAIDLASVAGELERSSSSSSSSSVPAAAFDFSGFAAATEATEAAIARAAEARAAAQATILQQQLSSLHSRERDEFKEKLAKVDLTRGSRHRKLAAHNAAKEYLEKKESKVMKRNEAKKRMNRAKNLY